MIIRPNLVKVQLDPKEPPKWFDNLHFVFREIRKPETNKKDSVKLWNTAYMISMIQRKWMPALEELKEIIKKKLS